MNEPVSPVHLALGALLVALAVAAIFARTRNGSALLFLAFGAVLATVWAVVGSPDVALAEAALGAGVMGALMVAMVTRHPRRFPLRDRSESPPRTLGVLSMASLAIVTLIVGVGAALTPTLGEQPRWGEALPGQLPNAGFEHGVPAVLLNFRAYDTLLESFVIVLGAVAVTALVDWPGGPPPAASPRLPGAFRWFVGLAAPALLVFAGWVLFAGTSQAGGAFQSGAVLTGLLILLRHSPFDPTPRLHRWLPVAVTTGVVVFVASAALGPLAGQPWLRYDPAIVGPVLVGVEIVLTLGIAAGLFALYLCLSAGDGPLREETDAGPAADPQPEAGEVSS